MLGFVVCFSFTLFLSLYFPGLFLNFRANGGADWRLGVGEELSARKQSYKIIQGFLSLKGFSEAGTPTSRGSFRACCSQ